MEKFRCPICSRLLEQVGKLTPIVSHPNMGYTLYHLKCEKCKKSYVLCYTLKENLEDFWEIVE